MLRRTTISIQKTTCPRYFLNCDAGINQATVYMDMCVAYKECARRSKSWAHDAATAAKKAAYDARYYSIMCTDIAERAERQYRKKFVLEEVAGDVYSDSKSPDGRSLMSMPESAGPAPSILCAMRAGELSVSETESAMFRAVRKYAEDGEATNWPDVALLAGCSTTGRM